MKRTNPWARAEYQNEHLCVCARASTFFAVVSVGGDADRFPIVTHFRKGCVLLEVCVCVCACVRMCVCACV